MSENIQRDNDISDEDNNAQDAGIDSDEEGGMRIDHDIYIPPPPKNFGEINTSGPRLMITKIVNMNFKSYAGEQIIGPFHKCFSAIVGPNGSGKSNVIDSMLFVFGYRASKIRSKNISVLIHNSSEHPNVKKCSVAIHFQSIVDKEGEDYEVVQDSNFVISRTAFKDNSNFYELNGKKVQFKQIAKLLRSYGVDLDHNRFLILQGEVEQIALMKPKGQNEGDTGMLEFLEDIIGTVRYKEPLEKLFNKVELLTETRVEKLNRLRVAEKEKTELEEPMQEAVEYLKVQNSITRYQHQVFQLKKLKATEELLQEEEKMIELNEELSNLKNAMQEITEKKNERNKELKVKCSTWDKLQRERDDKNNELNELRNKDEALHAELIETNKRRKDNIALVKSETAKLEELHRVPEKNAKSIEECEHLNERNIAKREKEEAALSILRDSLKEKAEPLLKQRAKLETELIPQKKNVAEAKSVYDVAKSKLELYTSTEQTEKNKLEQIKESLTTTSETLKKRKEQLGSFESKIPNTVRSLKDAERELEDVKNSESEYTARLKSARVKYDEQKSAMTASRSRNRVLDALMQQKREGKISGIFGRLGDLGAIDAKFDIAISTACGPLDNIVVDTVDTAQACIKFLREHDIGRASFIPLEKQQRFAEQCKQKIKTPENVSRLFDLIKVEDEKFLPAFFFGLQNTLVADNLDQATRIAYGAQRYRVVTLKGELIELAGTMSGGGRTVLKGRMGQSVVRREPSAEEVDKLQNELEKIYQECNRLKALQQPLENQIISLSSALKDMTADEEKYKTEIRVLSEQIPALKQQLKTQEKKVAESETDSEQLHNLTKAVKDAEKELERVEKIAKATETEVNRINTEYENMFGDRVKQAEKKVAEYTKSIEKTKAEICKLQVAIKTNERNVTKTEQYIETLESNVKKCENRLREIKEEKSNLEVIAKDLLSALDKLDEDLKERDELMNSWKEELSVLQTQEGKLKSLKIDLNQKFNEKNKLVKELQQKIPDYERKIKTLKLQAIPNVDEEELVILPDEELKKLSKVLETKLQHAIEMLPKETPNLQLIQQYQEKDELYIRRATELDAITTQRNALRDTYDMVRRKRMLEFMAGFDKITKKLKEMYQMITLGGDAELELVDSLDPFSEGIVFSVRPPKKSWKNISNLSGGEKTLSSLALVFALHHYKPTPLYFMDEIDAALDFKNVSIVAHYIKERTKNAQFIIISLRSNMFELADYLVGIYKTYNCTKCATLNLIKYREKHEMQPPTVNYCATQPNLVSHNQNNCLSQPCPDELELPATCPPALNHKEHDTVNDTNMEKNRLESLGSLTQVEKRQTRSATRSISVSSSDTSQVESDSDKSISRSKRRRKK